MPSGRTIASSSPMTALANFENSSGRGSRDALLLGDVVAVVQPDADDLARDGERRDELDVVERDPGGALERRRPTAEVVERVGVEVHPRQEAVEQRDHPLADEEARASVLLTQI